MTERTAPERAHAQRSEFVITAVLLVVFVYALVSSFDFPAQSSFVPRFVTTFGIAVCVLKLAELIWRPGTARDGEAAGAAPPPEVLAEAAEDDVRAIVDDEQIFAQASLTDWVRALGCFFGFFLLIWLTGMVFTVFAFTLGYLILVGRIRIIPALIYTVALWALLYYGLDQTLHITLPGGILSGTL